MRGSVRVRSYHSISGVLRGLPKRPAMLCPNRTAGQSLGIQILRNVSITVLPQQSDAGGNPDDSFTLKYNVMAV